MGTQKKGKRLKSLSQGRPPIVKPVPSVSRKTTRTLIRTHHTLEKQKAKALNNGDDAKATSLSEAIASHGGIEAYQRASLIGQGNDRGGDSSKLLMEWLEPIIPILKVQSDGFDKIRMLEVGALSTTNACSKSHLFEMTRIDLNSQAEGIQKQDFMDRPLPRKAKHQFDIISLSLVLNYVPDAVGRGDMLLRTLQFLKPRSHLEGLRELLPSLFLVLPAACVSNSRYLDEIKLESMMESIGYMSVKKKISNKLIYYLWRIGSSVTQRRVVHKKVEIRSGKSRNNFAIVMR
jgi:25S rRNA (adenine2142-N1)-methyltransferase